MSAVLFVIDNLEFGGGERGFLQLVRALAAEDWRVGVAAHPGGAFETEVRAVGAGFMPLDMTSRLGVGTVGRLRRAVKEGRFEIVHSQGARADFLTRLALLGLDDVRNVCTVQMPVEGFDVGLVRRVVYGALDRLSARRVDRFIVVSRALERLLVEHRRIGADRVSVIPNGVEVDGLVGPFMPPGAMRASLGVASRDRLIGAVGRLVWQKGFEDLILAMPLIAAAEPAARLVVVGDGPLRSRLAALARERGVRERVVLAGFRRDVAAFLRAVDVLVIPSRREGLPMITLEAMAVGAPVVATSTAGLVEQIEHEREGLLVPPGDVAALAAAVVRVLRDAGLRDRLAMAARSRVTTGFDLRRTVTDTQRVYRELVGAPLVPARAMP